MYSTRGLRLFASCCGLAEAEFLPHSGGLLHWGNPRGSLLSESVWMYRPLDPLFSPQVHPRVGYSNVKHAPVGYHFSVWSLWVIYVKCSYLATLLGLFLWKFHTPVGFKIHPADTPVRVKIHPANPTPLPVSGRSAPPGTIVWLPQCQWSNPPEYSWYIKWIH